MLRNLAMIAIAGYAACAPLKAALAQDAPRATQLFGEQLRSAIEGKFFRLESDPRHEEGFCAPSRWSSYGGRVPVFGVYEFQHDKFCVRLDPYDPVCRRAYALSNDLLEFEAMLPDGSPAPQRLLVRLSPETC